MNKPATTQRNPRAGRNCSLHQRPSTAVTPSGRCHLRWVVTCISVADSQQQVAPTPRDCCHRSKSPSVLCRRDGGAVRRRDSGRVGDGRHPGISGEGVADGGEDADAVLGGGGDVAADGVPVRGWPARSGAGRRSSAGSWPGRRSRSAWLEVGGMRRSDRNRSTSASRSRRHSSSSRAGGCSALAPGIAADLRTVRRGRRGGTAQVLGGGARRGRRPGPGRGRGSRRGSGRAARRRSGRARSRRGRSGRRLPGPCSR